MRDGGAAPLPLSSSSSSFPRRLRPVVRGFWPLERALGRGGAAAAGRGGCCCCCWPWGGWGWEPLAGREHPRRGEGRPGWGMGHGCCSLGVLKREEGGREELPWGYRSSACSSCTPEARIWFPAWGIGDHRDICSGINIKRSLFSAVMQRNALIVLHNGACSVCWRRGVIKRFKLF